MALVGALLVAFMLWRRQQRTAQSRLIETYRFPASLSSGLTKTYPQLHADQVELILQGLREYFQICRMAGRRMVAMPSQAVDVAWHEFILSTRRYQQFCRRGLGRFLHHTPAQTMKSPTLAQEGIKRAWRLACICERIDPERPDRLPLLFALDARLGIADGFRYRLNCQGPAGLTGTLGSREFCAAHIGCSSGCAGSTNSGRDSEDSGWGSGDSDGDSAGGCGGD